MKLWDESTKIFLGYIVFLSILLFSSTTTNAQALKIGDDLCVVHFNAGWNSANDVKWVTDVNDAKLKTCDIATDTKAQSEHEIVVVPTIIIFYEGEEVKRYQADISFTMKATLEEIQEKIDEIVMESF
tara:strand:+ start:428 stop:811 length:384 start_codon:yes stop_codon:yes gene_type:complete